MGKMDNKAIIVSMDWEDGAEGRRKLHKHLRSHNRKWWWRRKLYRGWREKLLESKRK